MAQTRLTDQKRRTCRKYRKGDLPKALDESSHERVLRSQGSSATSGKPGREVFSSREDSRSPALVGEDETDERLAFLVWLAAEKVEVSGDVLQEPSECCEDPREWKNR